MSLSERDAAVVVLKAAILSLVNTFEDDYGMTVRTVDTTVDSTTLVTTAVEVNYVLPESLRATASE